MTIFELLKQQCNELVAGLVFYQSLETCGQNKNLQAEVLKAILNRASSIQGIVEAANKSESND